MALPDVSVINNRGLLYASYCHAISTNFEIYLLTGAVDAHQSPVRVEGSSTFLNNSADQDGGETKQESACNDTDIVRCKLLSGQIFNEQNK